MVRDGRPPDASSVFDNGQQLPRPADGHEPGIVVVIGGEILMGREADNDHGFRVQSLGFIDGHGTDATGAGHFKCHLNKKLNAPNFIVESSNTDVYTIFIP